MDALNFKHLRYFWMAAKTGSIARAADQLHLTPQSISGQLSEFEEKLGVELFRRTGRNRELTDTGRRILSYAEEIFAVGDELLGALRDQKTKKTLSFRIGIADSLSKSIAYRLVEPALKLSEPVHLVCREGRLASLLAELAIHRLDMIIADRPMPANLNVRGYSHLLGESGLTVFGTQTLMRKLPSRFPATLDNAPFLLPGEDAAIRPKLIQWFESMNLRPSIIGEFDDSALMKAFFATAGPIRKRPAYAPRQFYDAIRDAIGSPGQLGGIWQLFRGHLFDDARHHCPPRGTCGSAASRLTFSPTRTISPLNISGGVFRSLPISTAICSPMKSGRSSPSPRSTRPLEADGRPARRPI